MITVPYLYKMLMVIVAGPIPASSFPVLSIHTVRFDDQFPYKMLPVLDNVIYRGGWEVHRLKIMGKKVEMRTKKVLYGFNSIDLIKEVIYLYLLCNPFERKCIKNTITSHFTIN